MIQINGLWDSWATREDEDGPAHRPHGDSPRGHSCVATATPAVGGGAAGSGEGPQFFSEAWIVRMGFGKEIGRI